MQESRLKPLPRTLAGPRLRPSKIARAVALVGYAGLWLTIALWYGWLSPSPLFGRGLAVVLLIPLAFPLYGLVRGRAYTHAWASMMALFYMALAMTEVMSNPAAHAFSYTALAASSAFFLGCVFYVRFLARER